MSDPTDDWDSDDMVARLQAECERLRADVARLEGDLRAVDAVLDRRDALVGFDNRVDKILACIRAATAADPKGAEAKLAAAEATVALLEADRQHLLDTCVPVEELNEARETLQATSLQLADANDTVARLEAERDILRANVATLEAALNGRDAAGYFQAEAERDEAKSDLTSFIEHHKATEEAYTAAREQLTTLQATIHTVVQEMQAREQALRDRDWTSAALHRKQWKQWIDTLTAALQAPATEQP